MFITNEQMVAFGVYCSTKTKAAVYVTGNYAILTFHSNHNVQERGYLLDVIAVPLGKCKKNV